MNRDSELEILLAKIRNVSPSSTQLGKWTTAVRRELGTPLLFRPRRWKWTAQLAAMLATGFILGSLSSKILPGEEKNAPVATAQYVYSKSE